MTKEVSDSLEESVYVIPNSRVGHKPKLHTNECHHVKRANTVLEKRRDVFPSDQPVCAVCSGTLERNRNTKESLSLFKKLSDPDFGPDDV